MVEDLNLLLYHVVSRKHFLKIFKKFWNIYVFLNNHPSVRSSYLVLSLITMHVVVENNLQSNCFRICFQNVSWVLIVISHSLLDLYIYIYHLSFMTHCSLPVHRKHLFKQMLQNFQKILKKNFMGCGTILLFILFVHNKLCF